MEQFANNAFALLSAAISSTTATSLTVVSGTAFPAAGNFRILIDTEILKVTAISGTTWTVARGDGGTVAATHASGATVVAIITKQALDALVTVQASGTETSNRRVLNFVGATVADDPTNGRANITTAGGAGYGAGSSRPAAGHAGALYIPSDGIMPAIDTGSAWVGINPGGAPFTIPPVISSWTSVTGSPLVTTDIPAGGITFLTPKSVVTTICGLTRTLANGSSYDVRCAISLLIGISAFEQFGMMVSDGTKIETLGLLFHTVPSGAWQITDYNNTTTSAGSGGTSAISFNTKSSVFWMRVTNDGTHRNYYLGIDGVNWSLIYQASATSFLTETAVGMFMIPDSGSGTSDFPIHFNLLSWSGA